MALTTTAGLCSRRPFTIPAERSMARASSTEVPPNFITIIGLKSLETCRSIEISLDFQQLGIEQGGASRAADGIVREHSKLPVEYSARTQPPYSSCHSVSAVRIEARLRT